MVKTLTNANIYIKGRSWLGAAKTITLPEFTTKEEEYEGLGYFGTLEIPTGLEPMVAEIEWISVEPEVFRVAANMVSATQLIVRGNISEQESLGVTGNLSYIAVMTARPKMLNIGEIEKSTVVSFPSEWAVSRFKLTIGLAEVMEFDVTANVYTVNGQDMLKAYRRNMGLEV